MGFFADAGPLQIFVSNHLIPDDFEFVGDDEPCYVSDDGTLKIQEGAHVRVKIVGSRVDQQDIVRGVLFVWGTQCKPILLAIHALSMHCRCTIRALYMHSLNHISRPCLPPLSFPQFCVGTIKEDFLGVIAGTALAGAPWVGDTEANDAGL